MSRPKNKNKTHVERRTQLGAEGFSLLAALSGSCGLAYEIIYVRLFSNYFGDSFVMSGIILSAVFLGIAFGAWQSTRFIRALAIIEITIGLYAFIAVTAFSYWGFGIASFGSNTVLNAVKLILLLGLPAFLIGTCVPLFARYAQAGKSIKGSVFTRIYAFYNLGAFLSVLAIEFILFRQLGILFTGIIIGCINLVIGATLLITRASESVVPEPKIKAPMNARIFSALFIASFASGVFQLFVLRLSFSIFGPLHENFAIILTSAILGVALGSWLALSKRMSFGKTLFWAAIGVLIFLSFVSVFIEFWAAVSGSALSDWGELSAKIVLLAGYPLAIFVLFGAMVPLAIKAHHEHGDTLAGSLLAISSLGNGLGTLCMFVVLYQHFSLLVIGGFISGLLFLSHMVLNCKDMRIFQIAGSGVIAASIVLAAAQLWPGIELLLGYKALANAEQMNYRRNIYKEAITYKAYDQSASLVSFNDQSTTLVLNGYSSLTFSPQSKSVLHETIVGSTPGLFSKNTRNALVFGLGTGITGGATARVYDHTKIVEINPAIFNIPQHFKQANNGVMHNAAVDVVLEDGISTLLTNPKTYDAIVNTVTSPQYYSAAKLYTQDFYGLVKSRLSEGGVYSSWFDLRIDRAGVSIMLNTLEASFQSCRYFVLTQTYFNVVCSNDPLIYRSSKVANERISGAGFDALFQNYKFSGGFVDTMAALEIKFGDKFLKRTGSDLNTLDLPAIEFVVARSSDTAQTADILGKAILANIEFQRKTSFGNSKWKSNCRMIAQMSGLRFKGC